MKPLSIFLLGRSLDPGGAERQMLALAKGLHERGHSVKVGLFYKIGALLEELEESGIEVVDFQKTGRWDVAGFLATMIAAVRRANPDVIYSFLGGGNLASAALRPFVRDARYVWSVRGSNRDFDTYGWLEGVTYRVECAISNLPDLIIANSSAGVAYSVRKGFPAGKFIVIPNGIDTSRFRPQAKLRAAQRKRFSLGKDEIAVGMLARFEPAKGYPIFLQAAALAAPKAPKLRFLCIGGGMEAGKLERLRDELGLGERVRFIGETDPVAALNALDIACSASLAEGFSNAIAEAMACGLPVVASDVGDSAMIVGDAGTVVPPGSPEALAEAILAQAASLGNHDPQVPRARIVENFSVSAMVERTLDAFHQRLGL